ncbi:unnamed protein product [Brassica napus]|uniref:(rape) hypothetical protein n=1 Tax=Brassica napus TaxID=3708 RepID=A0A816N6Q0_BRANA|nr:unnamed protein product [Brassica napus]
MSKMKLAFTHVAQLKPDSENEIWKIKVRIVRMWRFQNGVKPGDAGGIDLILLYDKGDRIQACIRGKLISKFEDNLGEGKCCILMNFKLSPNLGNYRGTPHPFKIFFTWSTHVKKNLEEIPNDSLRFNCISFDDLLSQKHDEKVFVDVIGEIVGPCDLKEITVRNAPCKILNLQLKDCGMSKDVMSTTSSGSLLTLSNCTQVSSDHIPFDNRKTISQLLTSYEETRCCIYATICALKIEAHWWYLGCPGCAKKVNPYLNPETEELEMDKLSCDGCETIVCSTKTRYQVHCKVLDHTGTTSFVMFDREVIQLIHKSAYELLEQQVQFNSENEFPRELLALEGREFVFTVNKPETSKNYTPSTFKTDIPAIGPHFSNSTETTLSLVNDVFEESNTSIRLPQNQHELQPKSEQVR